MLNRIFWRQIIVWSVVIMMMAPSSFVLAIVQSQDEKNGNASENVYIQGMQQISTSENCELLGRQEQNSNDLECLKAGMTQDEMIAGVVLLMLLSGSIIALRK